MDFRGASMQLQLHNLESKSKSLTRLSPNLVKPMMSRHSMTLSRHQNKLLQTPATLETLVPLQFRCIVLKPRRQHVSTHGYTIMEQPVARDLFLFFWSAPIRRVTTWGLPADQRGIEPPPEVCPRRSTNWATGTPVARDLFHSEAAGIMLVEPQQSSNNSLCSHPVASNTSQSGITCHKLQKIDCGSKPEGKLWSQKWSHFWLRLMKQEAVSQKLKLKMGSVKRDTNCPKRKENVAAPKKNSQWMCPTTFYTCSHRRMSSIKFHSSTNEAGDSLHASSCQNRFFFPSDASWLSPGRSTRSIACCRDEWIN